VGVLTVSMMGLRDAIVSSRQARVALLGDLVRQNGERRNRVSTLCAGFARDRCGRHRAWFGPLLFRRPDRGETPAGGQGPSRTAATCTAKAEPPRHKPTHKPVAARAVEPSMAPLPRAKKRSSKRLKKH